MRKLNARERGLLVALAMVGLVLWFALDGSGRGAGHSGSDTRAALADLGAPPVVHLELLGSQAAAFDTQGRNLFAYYTPPVEQLRSRRVSQPPLPPPPPRPTKDVIAKKTSAPSEPALPVPDFDYIGLMGPRGDLIAVFSKEAGVFVAQIGDAIDDTFELLDFRYGEVVLGVIGNEQAGATVKLAKSAS